MKKKITESLDVLGIVSWIITISLLGVIMYLEMNDISIRWAWNDLSRSYTSESMVVMLEQHVKILILMSGLCNAISCITRNLFTTKENVADDEFECYEEEEA